MSSAILSMVLKHSGWRATHKLDTCSAILVSGFVLNTGEQLTNWMWVQPFLLVALAKTLESDSQTGHKFSHSHQWFSEYWRATHLLDMYLAILCGSDLLKHQRDSQAGHMFSHSHQWFWFAQTLEWLTSWTWVQPFLSVVPICSKYWSDLHPGHKFNSPCQEFPSAQN